MQFEMWLVYLVAVIGVSLAPGPNGILALTHGVNYGRRAAKYTVLGGITGFVGLILIASIGVGALAILSPAVINGLKVAGALYLIWLGIGLVRTRTLTKNEDEENDAQATKGLFRRGFFTAVANPKVLLFYVAFLPQFIDPAQPLAQQILVLVVTFVVVEFAVEYGYVLLAHHMQSFLHNHGGTFNRISGGVFVLFGCTLPFI
ncbi:LysE family translocator [Vibrio coralliilyticus]|uniref:LysE family translocator n=1 Tax=Vibrio coralliilyticus TaxID=190893 RepID=UPI00148BC94D|nr:LysE family translocator [Vibrio coralliilyticus]NOI20464.1 LysE family translocator [Vibrio coralliilyticus]